MLHGLDAVPWKDLEHAYGSAADVPDLLRQLLRPDPKVRSQAMNTLYGNVFHQGTRFPAAPYVIPFLIELCASPTVPERGELLRFWGALITGFFSIQERPCWGDGERVYWDHKPQEAKADDPFTLALHTIYRESLKGYSLICDLLADEDFNTRLGSAWVLACLPTLKGRTVPLLEARLRLEESGWVRAGIAFALGELGAASPLYRVLADDTFAAAKCMAACELARIAPSEQLIEPLLHFVSVPIEGYEHLPGAGGKSTGDAAFSISLLPVDLQQRAIPAICDRLDHARAFDTMPLVCALLSAAFTHRKDAVTELTALQKHVLDCMVGNEELWSIGNLTWTFKTYGLPFTRAECAQLIGVKVAEDEALKALRWGLAYAEIDFLDKGRDGILKALQLDPLVFDRAPSQEECWLLCAKAFAPTDPERAIAAFHRAVAANPRMRHRVAPGWALTDLLKSCGLA